MQVKKFEAATMQEALKVIKRELGPDAIILSTKHIKSGFGLMSKASVEVTAAVAEKDLKKKMMAEKDLPIEVKEKIWNSKAEKQGQIYDDYFEKQLKRASNDRVEINAAAQRQQRNSQSGAQSGGQQRQPAPQHNHQNNSPTPQRDRRTSAAEQIFAQRGPLLSKPAPQPTPNFARRAQLAAETQASSLAQEAPRERRYVDIEDDDIAHVAPVIATQVMPNGQAASITQMAASAPAAVTNEAPERVRELEKEMEQLRGLVTQMATRPAAPATVAAAARGEEVDPDFTDELTRSMHDLVAAGVEKKLARQLVRQASFDLSNIDKHDDHAVQERVAFHLMQDIKIGDVLESVSARATQGQNTVLALVGPTGVGKTTTIAKIASLGILERHLRVGLINLDSYKVAAADQLATYARIMNVPFRSVNNAEELNQALYDFASLDMILIDTTGRSQKDQESLLALRHMLAAVPGCQNMLLVSATTKDSDLNEVVSRFKIFNPAGLVLSKLDETSVYGCLYNVQKRSGLPLLYFTVGQRVPEDIEKASAERVASLVLDL
jgi:flagellar biosynthesis protein FlhF